MNKIVDKCESHSVDISGLHKTVDFIVGQLQSCSEIIIQSVFGFMFSDCPWTMYIKKTYSGYTISVSSVDWQIFNVDKNDNFTYCWDKYDNLTASEFYNELADQFEDCRETRPTLAEIKDLIFQYFCEDYDAEDAFEEYGFHQDDIKDFTCYVIWKKE